MMAIDLIRPYAASILALAFAAFFVGCAPGASAANAPASAPTPASAPSATRAAAASPDDAVMADGRRWAAAFERGDTSALWDRFDSGMRAALGSLQKLDSFRAQVASEAGDEAELIEERVVNHDGLTVYVRDARFAKMTALVRITIAFDPSGAITGFVIRPRDAQSAMRDGTTAPGATTLAAR
jgi:hypothetical protein